MEIKKEEGYNLYYIDDALEFIIENKLNWQKIKKYFEEDLGAHISYYPYFNTKQQAEFGMGYLEGLIIMRKLVR